MLEKTRSAVLCMQASWRCLSSVSRCLLLSRPFWRHSRVALFSPGWNGSSSFQSTQTGEQVQASLVTLAERAEKCAAVIWRLFALCQQKVEWKGRAGEAVAFLYSRYRVCVENVSLEFGALCCFVFVFLCSQPKLLKPINTFSDLWSMNFYLVQVPPHSSQNPALFLFPEHASASLLALRSLPNPSPTSESTRTSVLLFTPSTFSIVRRNLEQSVWACRSIQ